MSVTVPGGYKPFNSDGTPNPGGGYTVFDWAGLAPHVDRLRLMTYDYSWNRPGPIGPHNWASESVRSAVAQVGEANRRKIYVGLHQYGKAWYVRDGNDDVVTVGSCKPGWSPSGGDSISLTTSGARSLAQSYGKTIRFDQDAREYTFDYQKAESGYWTNSSGVRKKATCTTQKRVYFGGVGTAAGRAEIVTAQGIGGMAVWQLAGLDAGFFNAVSSLAKDAPEPAPTVVPQPSPTAAPTPTYRMKSKVNKARPKVGSKVTLRGRIRPAEAGTKVRQQVRKNGKWRNRATAVTASNGKVKFRMRVEGKPRVLKLRLKVLRTDNHRVVLSPVVKVRPRR